MMMKIFKIGVLLCVLGIILAGAIGVWAVSLVHKPGGADHDMVVEIPDGASVKSVSQILQRQRIIDHGVLFEIYMRLTADHGHIQAGEYKIPAEQSMVNIAQQLRGGDVVLHAITIPEGYTNAQIKIELERNPLLTGTITHMPNEGYLMPETYHIRKNMARQGFIDMMHRQKLAFLDEIWPQRQADIPVKTIEQALVLASIVERETAVAAERGQVAGVFVNRLRKGMRLQSDPTVIYALTKGVPQQEGLGALGRRLLRKDLKFDSPYNTYAYAGLPPGAICNPGKDALRAVLNPVAHEYIYFVADGTGGHVFAKTLDDHNRNVAAWRRIRQNQ